MFKREKTKIILVVAVILLVLFGVYFLFLNKAQEATPLQATQKEKSALKPTKEPKTEKVSQNSQATLEIASVKYPGGIEEGTSVYDFMDKFRTEGKINFKDKTYLGMGKFIEEINGIQGDGIRYWIYYVNGKRATIGVSNYKINPGDIVSWKYEKEIY